MADPLEKDIVGNEIVRHMAKAPHSYENYSKQETMARREAALKRMLNTPHKPHKPIKGKSKKAAPKNPPK